MLETVSKKLFTVDEYYRMLEVGVIHPDDRIELIEGEIVQMAPMSCCWLLKPTIQGSTTPDV